MTRINPYQQQSSSSSTGANGTTGSGAGSSLAGTQLLQKLLEALVTIVQQVEKQVGGGSLSSGADQQTGTPPLAGRSQLNDLNSAYHGAQTGGTPSSTATSTYGTPSSTATSTYGTPSSTATSTYGTPTSTATGAAGSVGAVAGSGTFSEDQLHGYITKALSQGAGGDNSLSGPQNLPKWDPSTPAGKKNLDSFYNGIVSAQKQFYPEVPIDQFAKMMVAESAQESTLNPDVENGDGVIQANQSVRDDFAKYGKPLTFGNETVSPGSADSKDPGACVMLWAWRTRSSLDHGGNGPAQWGQNIAATQSGNFGNALSVWLQGPASQPFVKNGQLVAGDSDYIKRIQGYYAKIGGSTADFSKLATTTLKTGSSS